MRHGHAKEERTQAQQETIAGKRTKCHKARRQVQRAKTEASRTSHKELHKALRAELSHAIKDSKKLKARELLEAVNVNPWRFGYQIAMAKLKGPTNGRETYPDKLKVIEDDLFPTHKETAWAEDQDKNLPTNMSRERSITDDELVNIAKSL